MEIANSPLIGKALIQKIKECQGKSKREQARICGYISRGKDNQETVNLTEFCEAQLVARGYSLEPEAARDARGREPTFRVSVHKNGQIVIGATYTQTMGLTPGDEFEIKLGYKHIRLIQLATMDDDNEEVDED
jgi:AbrB-like transcriptional regulator